MWGIISFVIIVVFIVPKPQDQQATIPHVGQQIINQTGDDKRDIQLNDDHDQTDITAAVPLELSETNLLTFSISYNVEITLSQAAASEAVYRISGGGSGGGGSLDTTAPTVIGIFSRPSDTINDEYNYPVTVTWVGDDGSTGSGITSCDAPTNYSGPDGVAIVLIGHCIDNAGNKGTGSVTLKYNSADTTNSSYALSLNTSEINVGSDISATATTNNTSIKDIKFVWKDPTNTVATNNTRPIIQGAGNNSSATNLFTAPNQTGLWTVEAHFLNTAGNEVFSFTRSFTVVESGRGGIVNDPPVAVDDNITTPEDTPIVISILANDFDVKNDTLVVSSFTQAGNGSVTDNHNGTLAYSPNESFNGQDSFVYRISDGILQSNNATVTLLVTPINDSPIVNAGLDQNVTEEILVALDGSVANNSGELLFLWTQVILDPQDPVVTLSGADTLSPTFISPPVNHTVSPPLPITLTFKLVANDTSGATGSDTVLVTVNDVNKPPVANAGPNQIVIETSAVSLYGLNSSDADGDALTYSWNQTAGLSVVLSNVNSATPSFTAPRVVGNTVLTFVLTVSDPFGGNSSASVNITVERRSP